MEDINIIDAALANDKETFAQAFNAAIASKVNDALELKKVELASSLLTPETVSNETETVETEVSGTESIDTTTSVE